MKLLTLLFAGAVLFALFVLLILALGLRASRKFPPDELKALQKLMPADWTLVTWGWWDMGWFARFEFRGRRFKVGSHRNDITICEVVGAEERLIAPEDSKSPEEIYGLLAKTVA